MSSSLSAPASPTLVNIGTHCLALYAHRPEPGSPNDPIILFVSGIASSSLVWAGVIRLLQNRSLHPSNSLRSYTYDRSGYANSESSPSAPTAETIALELSHLISRPPLATHPLILVGHSWAGVLLRELILLSPPRIAGLVLVDANLETSLQVLNVADADLAATFAGVEPYGAMGLAAEHRLTADEWDAFMRDEATERHMAQGAREEEQYEASFGTLREKLLARREEGEDERLLGDKPVFVIGGFRSRDWKGLYKAGLQKGNGTEEQRRRAGDMIETADEKHTSLMRAHLKLSSKSKIVFARESGHFVQLTQPELVVDGVQWVLEELQSSS